MVLAARAINTEDIVRNQLGNQDLDHSDDGIDEPEPVQPAVSPLIGNRLSSPAVFRPSAQTPGSSGKSLSRETEANILENAQVELQTGILINKRRSKLMLDL